MQNGSIPLFSLLSQRMTWLSARQSVLSDNVANVDTPKYIAHDLKPVNFENLVGEAIKTTNVRHIKSGADAQGTVKVENVRPKGGKPNVVSLEQEMIKLSDTQLQYQTATNIYQEAVGMFRTALSNRF